MTQLSCAEVEELAPELALGTLPGDQRSAVLWHLDGCVACRQVVKELSDVADALLLAAPEVEPPPGFARRVTRGLRPARRTLWRPVVLAAGIALAVGILVGFLPGHLRPGNRADVRVASFASAEQMSGQVFLGEGNPSWVFMTVDAGTAGDRYTCDLILSNGQRMTIGSFPLRNGSGSWGSSVPVNAGDIRSVALLDPDGKPVAVASLSG